MFVLRALCMALIGVCIAVPLESPSSDQASPMLVELEPSPFINPDDQSEPINLQPFNNQLEPSSDDVEYFDPRIIGGSDAPDTKHMIALVIGWHVKSFYCGASLITRIHGLTAAHCIIKDWIHGGLLESYHGIIGSNTWNHGGSVMEFQSYIEHPEYNVATIKNDIAVLKMKTEVTLNKKIQPIRLELNSVDSGVPCYATGWGAVEVWGAAAARLQILYLRTISEEKCRKLMTNVVGQGNTPPIDYNAEICAFHSWGHGMCFGDSGSALVSLRTKRQVGVVSWGIACALGAPDVFVSVPAMRWFIEIALKHM